MKKEEKRLSEGGRWSGFGKGSSARPAASACKMERPSSSPFSHASCSVRTKPESSGAGLLKSSSSSAAATSSSSSSLPKTTAWTCRADKQATLARLREAQKLAAGGFKREAKASVKRNPSAGTAAKAPSKKRRRRTKGAGGKRRRRRRPTAAQREAGRATLMREVRLSPLLQAVVCEVYPEKREAGGEIRMSRPQVTKCIWQYARDRQLLRTEGGGRTVRCDAKLQALFAGREEVDLFRELQSLLVPHLLFYEEDEGRGTDEEAIVIDTESSTDDAAPAGVQGVRGRMRRPGAPGSGASSSSSSDEDSSRSRSSGDASDDSESSSSEDHAPRERDDTPREPDDDGGAGRGAPAYHRPASREGERTKKRPAELDERGRARRRRLLHSASSSSDEESERESRSSRDERGNTSCRAASSPPANVTSSSSSSSFPSSSSSSLRPLSSSSSSPSSSSSRPTSSSSSSSSSSSPRPQSSMSSSSSSSSSSFASFSSSAGSFAGLSGGAREAAVTGDWRRVFRRPGERPENPSASSLWSCAPPLSASLRHPREETHEDAEERRRRIRLAVAAAVGAEADAHGRERARRGGDASSSADRRRRPDESAEGGRAAPRGRRFAIPPLPPRSAAESRQRCDPRGEARDADRLEREGRSIFEASNLVRTEAVCSEGESGRDEGRRHLERSSEGYGKTEANLAGEERARRAEDWSAKPRRDEEEGAHGRGSASKRPRGEDGIEGKRRSAGESDPPDESSSSSDSSEKAGRREGERRRKRSRRASRAPSDEEGQGRDGLLSRLFAKSSIKRKRASSSAVEDESAASLSRFASSLFSPSSSLLGADGAAASASLTVVIPSEDSGVSLYLGGIAGASVSPSFEVRPSRRVAAAFVEGRLVFQLTYFPLLSPVKKTEDGRLHSERRAGGEDRLKGEKGAAAAGREGSEAGCGASGQPADERGASFELAVETLAPCAAPSSRLDLAGPVHVTLDRAPETGAFRLRGACCVCGLHPAEAYRFVLQAVKRKKPREEDANGDSHPDSASPSPPSTAGASSAPRSASSSASRAQAATPASAPTVSVHDLADAVLMQRASPSLWSVSEASLFLHSLRVPGLAAAGESCALDGAGLLELRSEDLQSLGVQAPFLRRRVLEAIRSLQGGGEKREKQEEEEKQAESQGDAHGARSLEGEDGGAQGRGEGERHGAPPRAPRERLPAAEAGGEALPSEREDQANERGVSIKIRVEEAVSREATGEDDMPLNSERDAGPPRDARLATQAEIQIAPAETSQRPSSSSPSSDPPLAASLEPAQAVLPHDAAVPVKQERF
ncbi:SWIB/MDM2 domain-containing protein [Besnoitia besnoiti]|uniref:SWIB/MDM2 domain-containing protein n=1 Tax=Besnoitia besnoiti TaxID=94643 RepID=A0A2A9MJ69_BESBE|nr:SWIB/MDM2 domain-containing protein [Besnoitia besnoiti]PFH38588.1 SWIB/MDM2 domain-containing protein [Besnoitia besnoiti]